MPYPIISKCAATAAENLPARFFEKGKLLEEPRGKKAG